MDSLLLIVPPAPGSGARVSPDTVVAGLPLLRRIVLAGIRAGFSRVLVQSDPAGIDRLLGGTAATALSDDLRLALNSRRRIVILPANVVPQPRWLRALRESEIEAERLYADASLTAVIDTADSAAVLAAAMRCRGAGELVERLRARFDWTDLKADDAGRFPLTGPSDTGPAETWLLRSLIKQREGFMSRHFERKISLALTRRLAATRVTPDAMTLVSLAAGLAGAACFVSPTAAWQLTGALLFLSHSILDGCDGELARLRFQESKWGAILDFWGDNIVHLAFFMGVATGWSREAHAAWPLVLGAVAGLAGLGAAVRLAGRTMRDEAPDAGASWASRLEASLASRDFIYAVVALSAFGKAKWFLAVAAIGVPIFLLLSLSTTRASRGG